jgi:hypothetical protein
MTEETAMAQAAQALLSSARAHKQASRFHRGAARKAMEGLAALQARCREVGIKLDVA